MADGDEENKFPYQKQAIKNYGRAAVRAAKEEVTDKEASTPIRLQLEKQMGQFNQFRIQEPMLGDLYDNTFSPLLYIPFEQGWAHSPDRDNPKILRRALDIQNSLLEINTPGNREKLLQWTEFKSEQKLDNWKSNYQKSVSAQKNNPDDLSAIMNLLDINKAASDAYYLTQIAANVIRSRRPEAELPKPENMQEVLTNTNNAAANSIAQLKKDGHVELADYLLEYYGQKTMQPFMLLKQVDITPLQHFFEAQLHITSSAKSPGYARELLYLDAKNASTTDPERSKKALVIAKNIPTPRPPAE